MLNIARGNEIASSVSGIALVDRAARRQAAVELRDAGLRAPGVQLPEEARGAGPAARPGAAGDADAAEEARQDAGAHGHRHPAGVAGRVVSHAGRTVLKLGRNFRGFDRFLWISRRCCLQ